MVDGCALKEDSLYMVSGHDDKVLVLFLVVDVMVGDVRPCALLCINPPTSSVKQQLAKDLGIVCVLTSATSTAQPGQSPRDAGFRVPGAHRIRIAFAQVIGIFGRLARLVVSTGDTEKLVPEVREMSSVRNLQRTVVSVRLSPRRDLIRLTLGRRQP